VRNTPTYFELRGTELAIFEPQPNGDLTFVCMRDTPSTRALTADTAARAQYGTDVVASDGWLYVFGFSNQPDDPFCPHRSYVARVAVNSAGTPSAWRFWSAADARWQTDIAQASPILLGQLTSTRIVDGVWLLAHKPWNGWGTTIYIEIRSKVTEPPSATTSFTIRELT
jgi:hypothetical protein